MSNKSITYLSLHDTLQTRLYPQLAQVTAVRGRDRGVEPPKSSQTLAQNARGSETICYLDFRAQLPQASHELTQDREPRSWLGPLGASGLEHVRLPRLLGVAVGTRDGGRARDGHGAAEAITDDGAGAPQFGDLLPAASRVGK